MSENNIRGLGDVMDGVMGEVEAARDKLVKRAVDLKNGTLDRFHRMDQGFDAWEKSLLDFDDRWNRKTNNPPRAAQTIEGTATTQIEAQPGRDQPAAGEPQTGELAD